ncbi:DNA-directed RNA polymerase III 47 kDa polypeptide [Rhodovastum atsumiense]|uniref:Uncharacterized protein n=1 Tax=Rhodovastum atsumiense TaxID=504468 RepID=A0A5M6IQV9_9PROT|nr:hypothetical protein [Rhodovastum atsumiense]KAA5610673.1 hypothetical protein F1189_18025 [Rhodovastum atsumiense]CAH2603333.1 DNA-directed RNA polymerase III 47 kDa polypeptide [Rhodovastum atsumiense]
MAQALQAAADCHPARAYAISEKLLRLFGLRPSDPPPMDPAALEAVLAFRGFTSFIGLPVPVFVPAITPAGEAADEPEPTRWSRAAPENHAGASWLRPRALRR